MGYFNLFHSPSLSSSVKDWFPADLKFSHQSLSPQEGMEKFQEFSPYSQDCYSFLLKELLPKSLSLFSLRTSHTPATFLQVELG